MKTLGVFLRKILFSEKFLRLYILLLLFLEPLCQDLSWCVGIGNDLWRGGGIVLRFGLSFTLLILIYLVDDFRNLVAW